MHAHRLTPDRLVAALLLVTLALPAAAGTARGAQGGYGNPDKVILVDTSERAGGGPWRTPLGPLWLGQLGRFYTVKEFGGPFRGMPGLTQDFRITPAALRGVDLFILTGFSGSITAGSAARGPRGAMTTREIDYTLSADEIAALDTFVRAGGSLLVIPFPAGRPDNLAALLNRFDIDYRRDDAYFLGEQPGAGNIYTPRTLDVPVTLAGRAYTLTALRWLFPLRQLPAQGATTLAETDGRPLIATVTAGAGRLLYLGLPALAEGMAVWDQRQSVAADNPAFLLDLVAYATGATPLTQAEARQVTWEIRLAVLEGRRYPSSVVNGTPRQPPSEIEWAGRLLASAALDRRCDVGPGCVDWRITPEQRALLEQAATEQAAVLRRFEGLEWQLQSGSQRPAHLPPNQIAPPPGIDYAAIERDYTAILDTLATDQARKQQFDDLYRQQGGKYSHYPDENPLACLRGLVLIAGLALTAGALLGLRRAWRRLRPRHT